MDTGAFTLSLAVWELFPDKYEGDDRVISRSGAFTATLCAFFIAEIGDKTQIATVGLAARFEQFGTGSPRSCRSERSA
jgi:putative Ca2+/H+ antiporter (TMEM165/GDT1 family)